MDIAYTASRPFAH